MKFMFLEPHTRLSKGKHVASSVMRVAIFWIVWEAVGILYGV